MRIVHLCQRFNSLKFWLKVQPGSLIYAFHRHTRSLLSFWKKVAVEILKINSLTFVLFMFKKYKVPNVYMFVPSMTITRLF